MPDNTDAMVHGAREQMGGQVMQEVLADLQQGLSTTVRVTQQLDAAQFTGAENGAAVVFQAIAALLLANHDKIRRFIECYYTEEADYREEVDRCLAILETDEAALGDFDLTEARVWHLMQMIFSLGMISSALVGEAIDAIDRHIAAKLEQASQIPTDD